MQFFVVVCGKPIMGFYIYHLHAGLHVYGLFWLVCMKLLSTSDAIATRCLQTICVVNFFVYIINVSNFIY